MDNWIGIDVKLTRDQFIKHLIDNHGVPDDSRDIPYLTIEAPCGNVCIFVTLDDIPDESVPCPCGNPKHWMIKYGF